MTNLEKILSSLWTWSTRAVLGDGNFLEQLNQHVHFVQGGSRVMAQLPNAQPLSDHTDYDYYFAIGKQDSWKSGYEGRRRAIAEDFIVRLRGTADVVIKEDSVKHTRFYSQVMFTYQGESVDLNFADTPEVYTNFQGLRDVVSGKSALAPANQAAFEEYQTTGEIKCFALYNFDSLHIAIRGYILKSFAKPLVQGASFSEETARALVHICNENYEDRKSLIAYMDEHYQGRLGGAQSADSYLNALRGKAEIDLTSHQKKRNKAQSIEKRVKDQDDLIPALEMQIAQLKTKIAALETASPDHLKLSIANLQHQNARTQAAREKIQAEVIALQTNLDKALAENEHYKSEAGANEKLVKKWKEAEGKLSAQREDVLTARNAEAAAKKEVARLQAQISGQHVQIAALEKDLAAEKRKQQASAPAPVQVKDDKAQRQAESERDEAKKALQAEEKKRVMAESHLDKAKKALEKAYESLKELRDGAGKDAKMLEGYKQMFDSANTEISLERLKSTTGIFTHFAKLSNAKDYTPELMAAATQFIQTLHEDDKENLTETLKFMENEWGENYKDNKFTFEKEYLEFDAHVDQQQDLKVRDFQTRRNIIQQRVKAWMTLLNSEPFKGLETQAREKLQRFSKVLDKIGGRDVLEKNCVDFMDKCFDLAVKGVENVPVSKNQRRFHLPLKYYVNSWERLVYESMMLRVMKAFKAQISIEDFRKMLCAHMHENLQQMFWDTVKANSKEGSLPEKAVFQITAQLMNMLLYYQNDANLQGDFAFLLGCMTHACKNGAYSEYHAKLFDSVFETIPTTGLLVKTEQVLKDFGSHPAFRLDEFDEPINHQAVILLLLECSKYYYNHLLARGDITKAERIYAIFVQAASLQRNAKGSFGEIRTAQVSAQETEFDIMATMLFEYIATVKQVVDNETLFNFVSFATKGGMTAQNMVPDFHQIIQAGAVARGLHSFYVADIAKIFAAVSSPVWREKVGLQQSDQKPDVKSIFSLMLNKSAQYSNENGCEPYFILKRMLSVLKTAYLKNHFPGMTKEFVSGLDTYCHQFMILSEFIKNEKLFERLEGGYFNAGKTIVLDEVIQPGNIFIPAKHMPNVFNEVVDKIAQFAMKQEIPFDQEDCKAILESLRPDIVRSGAENAKIETGKLNKLAECMMNDGYRRYRALSVLPDSRKANTWTTYSIKQTIKTLRATFPSATEYEIIECFLKALTDELYRCTDQCGVGIVKNVLSIFIPEDQMTRRGPNASKAHIAYTPHTESAFVRHLQKSGLVNFSSCNTEKEKTDLAYSIVKLIEGWKQHTIVQSLNEPLVVGAVTRKNVKASVRFK